MIPRHEKRKGKENYSDRGIGSIESDENLSNSVLSICCHVKSSLPGFCDDVKPETFQLFPLTPTHQIV